MLMLGLVIIATLGSVLGYLLDPGRTAAENVRRGRADSVHRRVAVQKRPVVDVKKPEREDLGPTNFEITEMKLEAGLNPVAALRPASRVAPQPKSPVWLWIVSLVSMTMWPSALVLLVQLVLLMHRMVAG